VLAQYPVPLVINSRANVFGLQKISISISILIFYLTLLFVKLVNNQAELEALDVIFVYLVIMSLAERRVHVLIGRNKQ